jgi:AbrB family looped-hinge helix DNA binding protein
MEITSTTKGQIVIPAALRRKYGIKQGTRIIVTDNGDSITLTPVTEAYLDNLQGSLRGSGALKILAEERKRDAYRGK